MKRTFVISSILMAVAMLLMVGCAGKGIKLPTFERPGIFKTKVDQNQTVTKTEDESVKAELILPPEPPSKDKMVSEDPKTMNRKLRDYIKELLHVIKMQNDMLHKVYHKKP